MRNPHPERLIRPEPCARWPLPLSGRSICSLLMIGITLLWLPVAGAAPAAEEIFSIYLVRHAEKATRAADPANPELSPCGRQRAADLAKILADVNLERIFSTDYERTRQTARPIADTVQREVEIYDPFELERLSIQLLEGGQNALVVGHSNTTAVLAGLLAGQSGESFDEELYDRLYQVVVTPGQSRIYLMHQAFACRGQED